MYKNYSNDTIDKYILKSDPDIIVKTIDNNFDGDIPQEYLQTIKNIFNNGITLWHNPSTMYNYSVSNAIVS